MSARRAAAEIEISRNACSNGMRFVGVTVRVMMRVLATVAVLMKVGMGAI